MNGQRMWEILRYCIHDKDERLAVFTRWETYTRWYKRI